MGDMSEVESNMNGLLKAFPKQTEKFMQEEAKVLKKQMTQFAKSKVKRVTGNYLKGFKAGKKVYKWSDAEYNVGVYNKAHHAHLIENGHRGMFWGHAGRWIPGKHVMEDSLRRFEPEFAEHVEKDLADFIVKELEK